MVKGIGHIGWALCVLILLAPLGVSESTQRSHSNQPHTDDVPQLTIDQNQGLMVESTLNISGTYVDEEMPSTLTWELIIGLEIVDQGDLLSNITQDSQSFESNRETWIYSFELNFSAYSPCGCLLVIQTTDTSEQVDMAQLILFSHGDELSDLSPQIIFENSEASTQLTGDVNFNVVALDDDGGVPSVQWALSNHSEIGIQCLNSWIHNQDWLTWNDGPSTALSPTVLRISLDTNVYDDGQYSLLVRAVSNDGLTSHNACKSVGIDNHEPVANLSGPSIINESDEIIIFDGSGSADNYWGRESLVFLWILESSSHPTMDKIIESGRNLRTFEYPASSSGDYTLSLTVADDAGFSDTVIHDFTISNVQPTAALRIDGQPLDDGDTITLADHSQWWLDCGESQDTVNDEAHLTCTWYLDGAAIMTGVERQLQRPEESSQVHSLTLEVMDDDGATDSISITFGIQGTDSDPMYANADNRGIPIGLIVGVIFTIILLGLVMFRFNKRLTELEAIPKWKGDTGR
ncbi:MAG: hypothetical protein VX627_01845 [Candidatus Thermoplasmatota archaeon]|nr:hypothetical protein [Candidatus Thermoplasmatota archaeon]